MKNRLTLLTIITVFLTIHAARCLAMPTMYLPWQSGKRYMCTQGNNDTPDHKGQLAYAYDLGIPSGEPILASAGGTVSSFHDGTSGYVNRSFGNYVIINHGDGTYALYAHMQNGSVNQFIHKEDQPIEQGQQVGRCGATGMATGPHLHIQVMRSNVISSQSVPFTFVEVGSPIYKQWLTSNNSLSQSNPTPAPPSSPAPNPSRNESNGDLNCYVMGRGNFLIELFQVGDRLPSQHMGPVNSSLMYRAEWGGLVRSRHYFVRVTNKDNGKARQTPSFLLDPDRDRSTIMVNWDKSNFVFQSDALRFDR